MSMHIHGLFRCFVFVAGVAALCVQAPGQRRSVGDLATPRGWARVTAGGDSFGAWLRGLPLKSSNVILSHRGEAIRNPMYDVLAVVDMPLLFRGDLEQCADFCMRFWAEYHKKRERLNDLYLFEYSGRKVRFRSSGRSYRAFLQRAFSYSNSHSLKKGCVEVAENDAKPGDMIVQNERGGIGHVSMIVDECRDAKGNRLYLIGFGFMPAQEFHIERAPDRYGKGGWFTLEGFCRWLSDNLDVGRPVLRRF